MVTSTAYTKTNRDKLTTDVNIHSELDIFTPSKATKNFMEIQVDALRNKH